MAGPGRPPVPGTAADIIPFSDTDQGTTDIYSPEKLGASLAKRLRETDPIKPPRIIDHGEDTHTDKPLGITYLNAYAKFVTEDLKLSSLTPLGASDAAQIVDIPKLERVFNQIAEDSSLDKGRLRLIAKSILNSASVAAAHTEWGDDYQQQLAAIIQRLKDYREGA